MDEILDRKSGAIIIKEDAATKARREENQDMMKRIASLESKVKTLEKKLKDLDKK